MITLTKSGLLVSFHTSRMAAMRSSLVGNVVEVMLLRPPALEIDAHSFGTQSIKVFGSKQFGYSRFHN